MDSNIIEKGYAKINLAIDVISKDSNNYHIVDMIMCGLKLYDEIYIKKRKDLNINVRSNLIQVPSDSDNICYKAVKLISEKLKLNNGYDIFIKKNIPMEAGLAGGSADAAAVLKGINKLCGLPLSYEDLLEISYELGADVSFLIKCGLARATHYGEKIQQIYEKFSYPCILIKPKFGISTKNIYNKVDSIIIKNRPDIDEIILNIKNKNVYYFDSLCYNVLEEVTDKEYPYLQTIKEFVVSNSNSFLCMMTGSGSTIFSLYENKCDRDYAYKLFKEKFEDCVVISTETNSDPYSS